MPNRRSLGILGRVEAMAPSNMSQTPATIRQITAFLKLPSRARAMPTKATSIPM